MDIKKVYKCFVASPADTDAEREALDGVLNEINGSIGKSQRFILESIRWEKDAVPDIGSDGQDVINGQLLGDDPDIFIGIMWGRFGAPTPRADSGTAEEFGIVLDKWHRNDQIKIMWYFNQAPIERNMIDPDQIGKVDAFKDQVREVGCLTHDYCGVEEFVSKVRNHIEQHVLEIKPGGEESSPTVPNTFVLGELENRLEESLRVFECEQIRWIDRYLCKTELAPRSDKSDREMRMAVADAMGLTDSLIIKAPPQFGLSCLSHYMVKEAWKKGLAWVYVDFETVSPKKLPKYLRGELQSYGVDLPDCIILDSWNPHKIGSKKIIESLLKSFSDVRVIIMQSEESAVDIFETSNIRVNREFTSLNLLALPLQGMRKAIDVYNPAVSMDQNSILLKLSRDISALNIHRTPLNCWTLLKVMEKNADSNPVNRTQMLEMVLFVLFGMNDLPQYKALPDAKDCDRVLGYFCGKLIREEKFRFTKESFYEDTRKYCKEKMVNIEIATLFEVLERNSIIIPVSSAEHRFKASFWIYYFGAKYMDHDEEFRQHILQDRRYASCSEIIEFYTGTTRARTDVLQLLRNDMESTRRALDEKIGVKGEFNPLEDITWNPSDTDLEVMKEHLSNEVLSSNVPDDIKDQHADKSYNQLKPYDQDIKKFLNDASFPLFLHQLEALSKALRNSDYADVEERKRCMAEVVNGWVEFSKILFILAPILANEGFASFEGHGFYLDKGFNTDGNKSILFVQILCATPTNVIRYLKDDLSSDRLAPLIYDYLGSDTGSLEKHLVNRYLVCERPADWQEAVDRYIISQDKNSYYLSDIRNSLCNEYKYGYVQDNQLGLLANFIKKCLAKHNLKLNNPAPSVVVKVPNKLLPKRKENGSA